MKKGLVMLAGMLMAPVMALSVAATVNAQASTGSTTTGTSGVEAGLNVVGNGSTGLSTKGPEDLVKNIINLLLMAIGIVSVIMLIIGGFKYTTSNGDANQVTSAKNTIMYSIIGLVVAIFAFAIVNFVVLKAVGN